LSKTISAAARRAGLDPDDMPPTLRVCQAAALANVSIDAVYDWLKRRLIEHFKFGTAIRVDTASLLRFISDSRH
jgi:excisionase family DNA binding protein